MDLSTLLPANALAVYGAMVLLWLLSLRLDDASIADVAWGPLFVVVAGLGAAFGSGWRGRRLLLAGLVAVWGVRLALHIWARNRGEGEDPRYRRWREEHGSAWPLRSLFQVFLLQGTILLVVALPVQVAQSAPGPAELTAWDVAGTLIWLGGFLFEAAADAQLRAFKRDPSNEGEILTDGLWRYSRHPNYFGEAVLWWGIWLVAVSVPWGWATAVGPLLLTWLLLRVSGVAMTEERMEGRPGFREYVERTNAFVPGPPES